MERYCDSVTSVQRQVRSSQPTSDGTFLYYQWPLHLYTAEDEKFVFHFWKIGSCNHFDSFVSSICRRYSFTDLSDYYFAFCQNVHEPLTDELLNISQQHSNIPFFLQHLAPHFHLDFTSFRYVGDSECGHVNISGYSLLIQQNETGMRNVNERSPDYSFWAAQ